MTRAIAIAITITLGACEPEPTAVTPSARLHAPSAATIAPTQTAIDARIEFEEGLDASYGQGATTVRAFLIAPALGVHQQLFAVPFPYHCGRRADPSLAVECSGDDGNAYATLRADAGKVIVTARDYGRLDRNLVTFELALPAGATANIYAPKKFPTSFVEK